MNRGSRRDPIRVGGPAPRSGRRRRPRTPGRGRGDGWRACGRSCLVRRRRRPRRPPERDARSARIGDHRACREHGSRGWVRSTTARVSTGTGPTRSGDDGKRVTNPAPRPAHLGLADLDDHPSSSFTPFRDVRRRSTVAWSHAITLVWVGVRRPSLSESDNVADGGKVPGRPSSCRVSDAGTGQRPTATDRLLVCPWAARASRMVCRPRWIRLRTVPSLTPSVVAISS